MVAAPVRRCGWVVAGCVALVCLGPGVGHGGKEENGNAWHTVQRGPFQVTLEVEGVFEASGMQTVRIELQEWSPQTMKVLQAVERGASVQEGQSLVGFDLEPLERAIRDAEIAGRVAEATVRQTEQEIGHMEASRSFELDSAERAHQRAEEDLTRFLETEREMARRSAEASVANAEQQLRNATEELRQLERMYRDEDLTEETEEIILQRQRHTVEMAEFRLEQARQNRQRRLEVELPRQERSLQEGVKQTALALERAREHAPLVLEQRHRNLERMRHDHASSERTLQGLRADLEVLRRVEAPIDGIVYYGRYQRGRWTESENVASALDTGHIRPGALVLTVAPARPHRVRVVVPERSLYRIEPGARGVARPVGWPDVAVPVEVQRVDTVPLGADGYGAVLEAEVPAAAQQIRPGMNCQVRLVAYRNEAALTVPLPAVRTDDETAEPYVKVRSDDQEEAERRSVRLGWRDDDRVEILEGLSETDVVQLQ